MERYGLIGHPVGHSKSPAMQEAGFQALGIQARYELVDVEPQNLPDAFQTMRKTHRGWNVTIPHKEAAALLVDELDEEARKLGSVNTVVNVGGRLRGFSTDGYGLEMALKEAFGFGFDGQRICFLGTGGAARATAVYAALHGAKRLLLVNRTLERAERLAEGASRRRHGGRIGVGRDGGDRRRLAGDGRVGAMHVVGAEGGRSAAISRGATSGRASGHGHGLWPFAFPQIGGGGGPSERGWPRHAAASGMPQLHAVDRARSARGGDAGGLGPRAS